MINLDAQNIINRINSLQMSYYTWEGTMSFTENELQLVAKVQTLSKTCKTIQKRMDTRKASLGKHAAVVKKASDALAKESNLLHDVNLGLSRLRKELLDSLKQGEKESTSQPAAKTSIGMSHYELGRED